MMMMNKCINPYKSLFTKRKHIQTDMASLPNKKSLQIFQKKHHFKLLHFFPFILIPQTKNLHKKHHFPFMFDSPNPKNLHKNHKNTTPGGSPNPKNLHKNHHPGTPGAASHHTKPSTSCHNSSSPLSKRPLRCRKRPRKLRWRAASVAWARGSRWRNCLFEEEKNQENLGFTLNYKENSGFPGFFPGVFFYEFWREVVLEVWFLEVF